MHCLSLGDSGEIVKANSLKLIRRIRQNWPAGSDFHIEKILDSSGQAWQWRQILEHLLGVNFVAPYSPDTPAWRGRMNTKLIIDERSFYFG